MTLQSSSLNCFPLVSILEEASDPPFSIVKKEVPVGKVMDMYDADQGTVRKVEFTQAFPTVMLIEGDDIWMSIAPFELEGLRRHLEAVRGEVLVGGLGLGVFPFYASKKGKVISIDIVEKEQKVIGLVYDQLRSRVLRIRKKCRVIHDDIYHYLETTDYKYDFIYVDIWGGYIDPIWARDRVIRSAQRCLKEGGEVRVWMEELVNRVKEKLPEKPVESLFVQDREPCLICGKTFRYDYAGLCMDCADVLGVSEAFLEENDVGSK